MSKHLFDLLSREAELRASVENVSTYSELADLYEGKLPSRYDKYFPKQEANHIINMIRLAHDDLATQVGRIPDFVVNAQNQTAAEMKRASKLEKIAFSYLNGSRPTGRLFMWELAWWLLVGRAVAIVVPDTEKERPVYELRDPRTCYPGVRRRAGTRPIELSDLLFKYEIPSVEAERRGLAPRVDSEGNVSSETTIVEYLDETRWVVVSEGGTAKVAEHGLGTVPGVVFQAFAPNMYTGISQFNDQISIMVAISRIISQKLAFGDRIVYPIYWVKGHEGSVRLGPYQLNKLSPAGEMGSLQPTQTLQADRDIAMLERFSRILNRNPEMRQGEISSRSVYQASKTLETLAEAIDQVVGRYWDVVGTGMQQLTQIAFRMDEVLWGDVERSISGVMRGRKIIDSYVPSKDIAGRYDIQVNYGFGVGGYQGFLQNVQANAAGFVSRRRVMEEMPGVSDVDAELRTIELEQMDQVVIEQFKALAAQGQLDVLLWAELRDRMAKKGTPLVDVIREYNERIQKQAELALAQGGAEALTAPPPPEGLPGEEERPMRGLPPAALAGV